MKVRLYSETIGTPVAVEYYDRPVDYIRDIIIDPENGKIAAFMVSKRRVVAPLDIIDWGNALVISDESHIVPLEEILRAKVVRDLRLPLMGQKVLTEANEYLGKVHDLSFDASSFKLHQLFVSRGLFLIRFFQTIIPAGNIIRITKKHILVKSALEKNKAKAQASSVLNPA